MLYSWPRAGWSTGFSTACCSSGRLIGRASHSWPKVLTNSTMARASTYEAVAAASENRACIACKAYAVQGPACSCPVGFYRCSGKEGSRSLKELGWKLRTIPSVSKKHVFEPAQIIKVQRVMSGLLMPGLLKQLQYGDFLPSAILQSSSLLLRCGQPLLGENDAGTPS